MGERKVQQDALFYEFSLERHVPEKHLLRAIDRFVELDGLRRELEPFYSAIGRPSIDPKLMIRMLIVGYCFGIRSERRLCEEVHLNLAYRWFCRLGLEGVVPDHSTFSKNRHGRFSTISIRFDHSMPPLEPGCPALACMTQVTYDAPSCNARALATCSVRSPVAWNGSENGGAF